MSITLADGNISGVPPLGLDTGATVSFGAEWHRKSPKN